MRQLLHILLLLSLLCSCGGGAHDALFMEIDSIIPVNPGLAMARLDSIDPSAFSDRDRNRYGLLRIKAADKSYAAHPSDSLILSVVDYYADHGSDDHYAEALYYAGRVYSDLGDAPTALRYFQQALEKLPEDKDLLDFRANILSQTGRLLNAIRLNDQAIPYLEECLSIDYELPDTFGIVYDNRLLGAVYLHLKDYDKASRCIREAIRYAPMLSPADSAGVVMYLADIQHGKGNIDSALSLVRKLPDIVLPLDRNRALSSAASIYYSAGIMDTAYMYAHELAKSRNFNNRRIGYNMVLSPDLCGFLPDDSVRIYALEYADVLKKYLDTHEAQGALIQNSYYNYQRHVSERDQIKASRDKIIWILIITLLTGLVLAVSTFYFKYKSSVRLHKVRRAMDLIDILRTRSGVLQQELQSSAACGSMELNNQYDLPNAKKLLLAKVRNLEESPAPYDVPESILRSDVYAELKRLISSGSGVSSPSLWVKLSETVSLSSPELRPKLEALTSGRLSETDFQIALLIKCGIPPKDMATLLFKVKGSISSRRAYLGQKIFGENVGITTVDRLIHFL
ncbi:MAG: tetratricopeptide repeat protein [Staphylococcus sp.]|nr:tetratricopeptide repeat protein [Staphylococcus sp.]